jgi:hypothetical protein
MSALTCAIFAVPSIVSEADYERGRMTRHYLSRIAAAVRYPRAEGRGDVIYHTRLATCVQPQVKGLTINSQYNGWRMEDVWLDR